MIYHHRHIYPVKAMCAFFGVSRAAYYAWVRRMNQPDPDRTRIVQIQEAYAQSHQTYGYRRISLWLRRKKGLVINPKAVLRLMHKLNLRSVARQRKIFKPRRDGVRVHHYPNHLHRDFSATQPNQKWVTDVTYLQTAQGWIYLSAIKDLFDGFIVAHQIGRDNSLALVLKTLQQASQTEKVSSALIVHSDQGAPYTSPAYFALLQEYAFTPSMSRRGNCWDNAPMENFFSHFKSEVWQHCKKPSFEDACQIVEDYIWFYNYERIQLKTGQTPYEIRCLSA